MRSTLGHSESQCGCKDTKARAPSGKPDGARGTDEATDLVTADLD